MCQCNGTRVLYILNGGVAELGACYCATKENIDKDYAEFLNRVEVAREALNAKGDISK